MATVAVKEALETRRAMETVAEVDIAHSLASIAVSLKRIADDIALAREEFRRAMEKCARKR